MSNTVGKNIALGCGLGCGGMIVLAILAIIVSQFFITPEMRAKMNKSASDDYAAGETSEKAQADAVFKSLSELRRSLPAGSNLREQRVARACVPVDMLDNAPYMAVDDGWFQQFTERGFVPAKPARNPLPWYRDQDFLNIEAEAVPAQGMPGPDYEAMLANAKDVKSAAYIAVFLPLAESWPVLSSDGKSFQGGVFRGWVILVDGKTRKPLGQTEFTAVSSTEIESMQISIHDHPLAGGDLKAKLEKDFTDHFWQAADAAVSRICGHPNENFASHDAYFITDKK